MKDTVWRWVIKHNNRYAKDESGWCRTPKLGNAHLYDDWPYAKRIAAEDGGIAMKVRVTVEM